MPELPELEIVREVLSRKLAHQRVQQVVVSPKGGPIVIRDLTGRGFVESLTGVGFGPISRRGKFLLFEFIPPGILLAANPKLTGRFQLCPPTTKKGSQVHVRWELSDPALELRYLDQKRMGQLYLCTTTAQIPGFQDMGPEAHEIELEIFRERLLPLRGEIKGILTRERVVAGIGNAYADEILWEARIHPYRKRTTLSPTEIEQLHAAMIRVLCDSIEVVRKAMGDDIHRKPRDFFKVHMQEDQPCPRCGSRISSIKANQRITNFCRTCQPGGKFFQE